MKFFYAIDVPRFYMPFGDETALKIPKSYVEYPV